MINQADASVVISKEQVTDVIEIDNMETVVNNSEVISIITAGYQGPMGPKGADGSDGNVLYTISNLNTESIPLRRGTPVYQLGNNSVGVASNDDILKCRVYGIVYDEIITPDTRGNICTVGIVEATVEEWSDLTDNVNGLTPGLDYFLGLDGKLSQYPDMNAKAVTPVGDALTPTLLSINIKNITIL